MIIGLPKTLTEYATTEPRIPNAYVDLPDKSASWRVEDVLITPDGIFVNGKRDPTFTGNETVAFYFDVRNFGGTLREITIHIMEKPAQSDSFFKATNQTQNLRAKLEKAYRSAIQQSPHDYELWMFSLEAYVLIVEDGQRLDEVLRLSNTKLAKFAKKRGDELVAQGNEVAYFFQKR